MDKILAFAKIKVQANEVNITPFTQTGLDYDYFRYIAGRIWSFVFIQLFD